MKSVVFGIALVCSLFIGCPSNVQTTAYRTVVGAKAFLDTVKSMHPECPAATTDPCPNLAKATAAKDLLIDGLEIYCASPTFSAGGTCTPPTDKALAAQATSKLQALISGYNQSESDLRAVIK